MTAILAAIGIGGVARIPGGSLSATMTVAATTDTGPPQIWDRGYAASSAVFPGGFLQGNGSLTSTTLGTATVLAIYWESSVSGTSGGQVAVELQGTWSAGSLHNLTVAGVSQGSPSNPIYSGGNTKFSFGASSVANPFTPAGGNLAITLS